MAEVSSLTSSSSTDSTESSFQSNKSKLVISGISLIPFSVVTVLLMAVLYGINKTSLTKSIVGDVAVWLSSFAVFFGSSYGLMMTNLENVVPKSD